MLMVVAAIPPRKAEMMLRAIRKKRDTFNLSRSSSG
jgi:hypothetical protein